VNVIRVAGRGKWRRDALTDLERPVLGNEDERRIRDYAVTVADVGANGEHTGVRQPG